MLNVSIYQKLLLEASIGRDGSMDKESKNETMWIVLSRQRLTKRLFFRLIKERNQGKVWILMVRARSMARVQS